MVGGPEVEPEGWGTPRARYGLRARQASLPEALLAFGFASEQEAREAGRASFLAAKKQQRQQKTALDNELSYEEGLEAFLRL